MKKIFGKIIVDNVTEHQYKKGVFQAQLRQTVTTEYPSQRVGNSNSDMLFSEESFNIPVGQSFNSTRITWIPVPQNTTLEQVAAKLEQAPDACIYRIISNNLEDVLTDEQKQGILLGLRTKESFEESLKVRDNEGNIILPVQYRQNFFSGSYKDDVDYRTTISTPVTTQNLELVGNDVP